MAKKKETPAEPAELAAARELVRQAEEQGLSLTGPDGLLKQLTKTVLETALDEELTEHLGHDEHRAPAAGGNVRNGAPRSKTGVDRGGRAMSRSRCRGSGGDVRASDRAQAATSFVGRRRDRVVALREGLTTGEISAHFAEIYGASVSKETVSRITDRVLEEMADWSGATAR